MSLSIDPKDGVRVKMARRRGWGIAALIVILEAVFSFFLYMSLAEKVFVVVPAGAAITVPNLIAYQGMLTSTSGSPLGGSSGAVYCFRYSIWDSSTSVATATDQLWPAAGATPATTTATVTNGVFSTQLGSANSLTGLNFEPTSSYYLQVAVNETTSTCSGPWDNLMPRQQIVSDAFAQTSQAVYGNLLRTEPTSTGFTEPEVQIGMAGGGAASGTQTLLSLDQVNVTSSEVIGGSCSVNGTLWYDTSLSRALVCEGSQIWPLPNTSTTIAGIGANGSAAITSGNIVLSAGANITLNQGGSVITINGAAGGGGGGVTLSQYEPFPFLGSSSTLSSALSQNNTTTSAAMYLEPFVLQQAVSMGYVRFPVQASVSKTAWATATTSYSSSASEANTLYVYIFTSNNSTSLSSYASTSASWGMNVSMIGTSSTSHAVSYTLSFPASNSNGSSSNSGSISSAATGITEQPTFSANYTGIRYFDVPFSTSLPAGNYWMGIERISSTSGHAVSFDISLVAVTQPFTSIAPLNSASNVSYPLMLGLGYVTSSVTTAAITGIPLNNLSATTNDPRPYFQFIRIS